MIVDERFRSYICSLERSNGELLDALEQTALETDVPIIRKETQSFLKTMLVMNKPKQILEVGTAIGFSALLMAEFAPADCRITTIEKYEKRIPLAHANFERFGRSHQITLLEGDATLLLGELTQTYDFIFMDAAKAQYVNYLPDILRLLAPGGVLVSDNVLQDGDIIESHFAIPRRNRTIHARMREYLYTLKNHPLLETTIVPLGDGITLSVKREA
ncbi:MAG: O-methyltransferase [Lachnospiraceae bacterium]|nr:O-methyltransferase [Lachnospiraceae bacterium]